MSEDKTKWLHDFLIKWYTTQQASMMDSWNGYKNYPPTWDTDDDEVNKFRPCNVHEWVETGMKKSWCKHCETEAEWTIEGWIEVSKQRKSSDA